MRLRRYSRPLRRHIYPTDTALSTELPRRPAALRLFSSGGVAWAIGLDFDPKGHSAATVAEHAADAARFFRRLGGRVIVDTAVSGGRHVWVLLSVPMNLRQAQQLAHACRRLWPTLDISPMVNVGEGCLTGPGSRCKDGRYRTLITPLDEAVQAVTRRSAHDLVDRALDLLAELVGPIDPADAVTHATTTAPAAGGARRPLGPVHSYIATHGIWPSHRATDRGQPWTRSEACYAVLRAAVRRGYTEDDVLDRLESGQWSGLLNLYTGRYAHHWRRRFKAEWRKALSQPSTDSTQAPQSTGGHSREDTERDFARRWLAVMTTVADPLIPGRDRHNARALLWALGWLAWRTGRRYVEAGTRSYARGCAGLLDHSTVAGLLATLRTLPDDQRPLKRISSGRGTHGDLYELVIPPAYADLATDPATWPEPRPIPGVFGVRDANRPRTKLLGATGWRIYQALTSGATGTAAQIARAAGVSRAEAYNVLPILARLNLARTITNEPGTASSWQVGERTTEQAGGAVDAPAHLAQLDARHASERAQWREVLAAYAERRAKAIDHTPEPDEPLFWPADWTTEPPEHPDAAEPGAGAPGQHHGVDPDQHAPAAAPGEHHGGHEAEAAAIALLTEAFGAQLLPQPLDTAPRPARGPWLAHTARKTRE
jgi:hypothetical protein